MVTWWKDRDKALPVPPGDAPSRQHDFADEPELPFEDIGDVADDDSEAGDDAELPERDLED